MKICVFNTFTATASIFLYNSELWTLNTTRENEIDAFQRKQIRILMGRQWPNIISNENLYRITEIEPWSITIKRRRLNWLGHLLRMNKDTPARIALTEYFRYATRKVGRPPSTWIKVIEKDLQAVLDIQINSEKQMNWLAVMAEDRKEWREFVDSIMLQE